MNNEKETFYTSFLGTGWSFPPTFLKAKKGVKMISDEEDIESSLEILLTTSVRERILEPKYGCNLRNMLFEPLNTTTITEICGLIEQAILHYESRIEANTITIEEDNAIEGRLNITIDYTILSTNNRYNLVYPFYRYEGITP
jgi:phage baseplate assembly protein W